MPKLFAATAFSYGGDWHPGCNEPKECQPFPQEQVPLCEDLHPGVLQKGEKCWSRCGKRGEEDCMTRVAASLAKEDGELHMVRHPACMTHYECKGVMGRSLCEARVVPPASHIVEHRAEGPAIWAAAHLLRRRRRPSPAAPQQPGKSWRTFL